MSNEQRIIDAITQFPAVFGLRAYPGEKFSISPGASYLSGDTVMLYTCIQKPDGSWDAFCKGTIAELRDQITQESQTAPRQTMRQRVSSVSETDPLFAPTGYPGIAGESILRNAIQHVCAHDEVMDDASDDTAAYWLLFSCQQIVIHEAKLFAITIKAYSQGS